jgi:hypothetical protein
MMRLEAPLLSGQNWSKLQIGLGMKIGQSYKLTLHVFMADE